MKELKGTFGTAKIMTDNVDEISVSQIQSLLDDALSRDCKIRIMPDVHAGKDNVIGLTMKIAKFVAPSLIGSDIGCGVRLTYFLTSQKIDLKKFDEIVHKNIPSGYHLNEENLSPQLLVFVENVVKSLDESLVERYTANYLNEVAKKGIGTLGGGNHFIELYEINEIANSEKTGFMYAIGVHTGSRTLGGIVYNHFQKNAKIEKFRDLPNIQQDIIKALKEQGREKEIIKYITMIKSLKKVLMQSQSQIPCLDIESKIGLGYIRSTIALNHYASLNRHVITEKILMNLSDILTFHDVDDYIDKPHNYIAEDLAGNLTLRKGSQSAKEDEEVLIPINMRDGMIVGKARLIEDWNDSFPHGAGRVYSRTQARQNIDLKIFEESMSQVYSTTVGEETLDEAPMAYKSLEDILNDVVPLLKSYKIIKPIYNFKGGKEHR